MANSGYKFLPGLRGLLGLAAVLCAAGAAGCGSTPRYLTAQPVSVQVDQEHPDWNVVVKILLRDNVIVHLENHGERPILVRWDESAYIDVNQRSHPVVLLSPDPERPTQSVLAPGTYLEEELRPIAGAGAPAWDPLLGKEDPGAWWNPFDGRDGPTRIGSEITGETPLAGKQVGFFFVLERDGVKKNVTARFRLTADALVSWAAAGSFEG